MTPPTGNADTSEDEATSTGSNATRRGVLRAVTGVAAAAALGGVASGSRTDDRTAALGREATDVARRPGGSPGPDGPLALPTGGDALTGAASLDPPRTLGEVWRTPFTDEVVALPQVPADSASNRIYAFGTSSTRLSTTLYAVDRESGDVAWSRDEPIAPPTLAWKPGESLFVGKGALAPGSVAQLVARSADDGSVQWRNTESFGSQSRVQPVYVPTDRAVYALTTGPTVVALDAAGGGEQWRVGVGNRAIPVVAATDVSGGRLFVTSNELSSTSNTAYVTAVDTGSETDLWTVSENFPVGSNVLFVDDTVYSAFNAPRAGTSDLVAFDAASGSVEWRETRTDGLLWAFVLPHADGVYGQATVNRNGTTEGEMVKFDSDGNRQWTYDAGAMILGTQVTGDAVHIATRDGRVVEVTDPATGQGGTEAWSTSLNAGIRDAALRKAGDVLYTGTISDPGRIYAIDANDGSVVDTYNLADGVTGGMVVYDDRIWVAGRPQYDQTSGDSALYELGDGDGDDGSGSSGGGGNGGSGDDDGLSTFVSQYDDNGNGDIEIGELNDAARDYIDDKISIAELNEVARAYIR